MWHITDNSYAKIQTGIRPLDDVKTSVIIALISGAANLPHSSAIICYARLEKLDVDYFETACLGLGLHGNSEADRSVRSDRDQPIMF